MARLGGRNVQLLPFFAFVLGFLVSYIYFHLSTEVCIFQSVGISKSVVHVSPNQKRISRYSGSTSESEMGRTSSLLQPRKILIDCGANTASTVQLFRETYPGGHDFIIHSFEIDGRLAPYFAPYTNHVLHCPMAVSDKNGTVMAYSESSWSPHKGNNNGVDMQWGGGTLFVDHGEEVDKESGGRRRLSVRSKVPSLDISAWIKKHTTQEDHVIFKLDVEGAEFDILDKMVTEGTFAWIDKFYGEYHFLRPTDQGGINQILTSLNVKLRGKSMLDWAAEQRNYEDFDRIHPIDNTGGLIKSLADKCSTGNHLSIVLLMSMNAKQAQKIFKIIQAYRKKLPITIFLYGDFVELFPEVVQSWLQYENLDIGIRGDFQYPTGHLQHMGVNWIREAVVSAQMRLSELQILSNYFYPAMTSKNVVTVAKSRRLTIIQPSAAFPPFKDTHLEESNYYKFRDVERIPKALRIIHEQLEQTQGGILSLDTDLPDTHMIIVFLLDYLVDNSPYNIVSLSECIQM